jgi:hypothetical protein
MSLKIRGREDENEDECIITIMDIKNLNEAPPFITKDGSEIRELLAHRNSVIRNQSLAEARVPVGASTQEHYHVQDRGDLLHHARRGTDAHRRRNARRETRRRHRHTAGMQTQALEHRRRTAAVAVLLRARLRAR